MQVSGAGCTVHTWSRATRGHLLERAAHLRAAEAQRGWGARQLRPLLIPKLGLAVSPLPSWRVRVQPGRPAALVAAQLG